MAGVDCCTVIPRDLCCSGLLRHALAIDHTPQAGSTALASASYGNVGYFGIPMTIALLGTQAAVPAAIIHLLHNLVFLVGYPVLCGDTANSAQVARGSAVQRIG